MEKTFVLDTNVLIHDPDALFQFGDNRVVLPIVVIEELDNLKRLHDERGRNSRLVTRRLDELRGQGNLSQGVKLSNGGLFRIELNSASENLPFNFTSKADNRILGTALYLKGKGEKVIFISKDMNVRIKAEVFGLEVQDYEKEKIKFEELYPGWREQRVKDEVIDSFYKKKKVALEGPFLPNEFLVMRSETDDKKSAIARYDKKENAVVALRFEKEHPWGLKPLNVQQKFAFEALLDENIMLVTLVGIAGTGKTLLALGSALKKVFDDNVFRRLLITRPVIPMGKDLGFLPGSKEEKLAPWMGAIYDNMEFLLETSGEKEKIKEQGKMYDSEEAIEYLFSTGKLQIEALAYIRGRSLPKQFMIVDEAQNLTPLEIKTIISRAGEGTKVVLTGDPYQIDNPYLDATSCGLTYCVERFKGQEIFAQINLAKTERSLLAALAAELL